jgi:hypothetical protein
MPGTARLDANLMATGWKYILYIGVNQRALLAYGMQRELPIRLVA